MIGQHVLPHLGQFDVCQAGVPVSAINACPQLQLYVFILPAWELFDSGLGLEFALIATIFEFAVFDAKPPIEPNTSREMIIIPQQRKFSNPTVASIPAIIPRNKLQTPMYPIADSHLDAGLSKQFMEMMPMNHPEKQHKELNIESQYQSENIIDMMKSNAIIMFTINPVISGARESLDDAFFPVLLETSSAICVLESSYLRTLRHNSKVLKTHLIYHLHAH